MILIAHRGNVNGSQPENENNLEYIKQAMEAGYSVEIDVWKINGKFFLGHDTPDHEVSLQFLTNHSNQVMVNVGEPELFCQLEAMLACGIHCFWHEEDDFTLTSNNKIWTYPNKDATKKSIVVCNTLEECIKYIDQGVYGVCSDYVGNITTGDR